MDEFNRNWIIERAVPIVNSYNSDITIRALHYRLVALGFPNTIPHYKRVGAAMTAARWDGLLRFNQFVDHERARIGETDYVETILEDKVNDGIEAIDYWMTSYYKNRWENQPNYIEVWIEKKALISAFKGTCYNQNVALCPCKGYPSLTFLNDAKNRFLEAEYNGKNLIMLYFGDYDPSGEDIPRSIDATLSKMGVGVNVKRIALMEEQVISMGLPPAPTKAKDTRSGKWGGIGQVELDAIEPNELALMVEGAIDSLFDEDLGVELLETQSEERAEYIKLLKEHVESL